MLLSSENDIVSTLKKAQVSFHGRPSPKIHTYSLSHFFRSVRTWSNRRASPCWSTRWLASPISAKAPFLCRFLFSFLSSVSSPLFSFRCYLTSCKLSSGSFCLLRAWSAQNKKNLHLEMKTRRKWYKKNLGKIKIKLFEKPKSTLESLATQPKGSAVLSNKIVATTEQQTTIIIMKSLAAIEHHHHPFTQQIPRCWAAAPLPFSFLCFSYVCVLCVCVCVCV